MDDFNYQIIRSGSKGNAVILGNSIMVDCGVPWRAINGPHKHLALVLLTHIHSDHFKPSTIHRLANERPMLRFACWRWLLQPLLDCGVEPHRIDVVSSSSTFLYRRLCEITPIDLVHDVPNIGYKITMLGEDESPIKKIFYATDTGNLNGITAPDYDLYLLEANYGAEEIKKRLDDKKANGEYAYEHRVMKTHLSLEQCNDFIYANIGAGGEYVYLHQHE